MTKYLLAIVAVVGMGTVACGGNDCEEAATRISDQLAACSSTTTETSTSTDTSTEAECTEEQGKAAQALADCYAKVDVCKALSGDADAAKALSDCSTAQ